MHLPVFKGPPQSWRKVVKNFDFLAQFFNLNEIPFIYEEISINFDQIFLYNQYFLFFTDFTI